MASQRSWPFSMLASEMLEPAHEPVQRAHELGGLLGAAQLGRRHDLDERHAGAVEIDERDRADVRVLAGVLLEVDARAAARASPRRRAIRSTWPSSHSGSSYCEIW